MISGTYFNLYSMQDTIAYQTCIFREDESIPHGEGRVDDAMPCRVVWVAKSTFLAWDSSEGTAQDIAKVLNAEPRRVDVWVLRSKFEAITALVEQVNYLYVRATFISSSRFEAAQSGMYLSACQKARKTLKEYNETLNMIETMLKEVDHAVAATLSPVR